MPPSGAPRYNTAMMNKLKATFAQKMLDKNELVSSCFWMTVDEVPRFLNIPRNPIITKDIPIKPKSEGLNRRASKTMVRSCAPCLLAWAIDDHFIPETVRLLKSSMDKILKSPGSKHRK